MMPSCDHTGVPIHFHSSTTSGSACLISSRILRSVSPRQSPSSAILFEMSCEGFSGVGGFFKAALSCEQLAQACSANSLFETADRHIALVHPNQVSLFAISRRVHIPMDLPTRIKVRAEGHRA